MLDLSNLYTKLQAIKEYRTEDPIATFVDFLAECHDKANEVGDPTLIATTGHALEVLRAARTPSEVAAAINVVDNLSRLIDCEGSA